MDSAFEWSSEESESETVSLDFAELLRFSKNVPPPQSHTMLAHRVDTRSTVGRGDGNISPSGLKYKPPPAIATSPTAVVRLRNPTFAYQHISLHRQPPTPESA